MSYCRDWELGLKLRCQTQAHNYTLLALLSIAAWRFPTVMFSLNLHFLYTITVSPLSVCSRLSVHAMWNMESRWAFNLSWHCYTWVLFWHSTHSAWENSHSLLLCHSVCVPSFLASLPPLVLSPPPPPSLPVTANLAPANTGSSKCTTNKCAGTVLVVMLQERGRGEKPKSENQRTLWWDTKDTDTHTHTITFQVNVSLFDILMVHPDFSKQLMRSHCKWEYVANR